MEAHTLEMLEVGPCETPYQMGFFIGRRFSRLIQSRLSRDLILQNQLLPWARAPESRPLLEALCENNRNKFPRYWDELVGTAEGSGVPVLDVILCVLFATKQKPRKKKNCVMWSRWFYIWLLICHIA